MDEHTISPAGDPFYAAGEPHHDDTLLEAHYASLERLEHPHGCLNGVVYIGHMVEGADGEEVEVFMSMPCRRCSEQSR